MSVAPLKRGHVNTRNAWIFFGITVVEAIANCALEGVLFYFVASAINIRENLTARTIPTYLSIYILALYSTFFVVFLVNSLVSFKWYSPSLPFVKGIPFRLSDS